jgi:hypothetical protein
MSGYRQRSTVHTLEETLVFERLQVTPDGYLGYNVVPGQLAHVDPAIRTDPLRDLRPSIFSRKRHFDLPSLGKTGSNASLKAVSAILTTGASEAENHSNAQHQCTTNEHNCQTAGMIQP